MGRPIRNMLARVCGRQTCQAQRVCYRAAPVVRYCNQAAAPVAYSNQTTTNFAPSNTTKGERGTMNDVKPVPVSTNTNTTQSSTKVDRHDQTRDSQNNTNTTGSNNTETSRSNNSSDRFSSDASKHVNDSRDQSRGSHNQTSKSDRHDKRYDNSFNTDNSDNRTIDRSTNIDKSINVQGDLTIQKVKGKNNRASGKGMKQKSDDDTSTSCTIFSGAIASILLVSESIDGAGMFSNFFWSHPSAFAPGPIENTW